MTTPKTTLEVLEKLTPHEAKVLRSRFGVMDQETQHEFEPTLPPDDDEDGGSGGVPAPAVIHQL